MTKSELISIIKFAFLEVKLEDGIGVYEADCIDDYVPSESEEYLYWKSKDERDNWENLLSLFLSETIPEKIYSSCWSFMDAKGKRFVLPCFLIQELEEISWSNNPIYFTLKVGYDTSDFRILNQKQLNALKTFFEFQADHFFQNNDDVFYDECVECLHILKIEFKI